MQSDMIPRIVKYIEDNLAAPLSLTALSRTFGYSEYHFSREFRRLMGLSAMEYISERRMAHAKIALLHGSKIIQIAMDFGYQNHSSFTRAFTRRFGLSPAAFRLLCLSQTWKGSTDMKYTFLQPIDRHLKKEDLLKLLEETVSENGNSECLDFVELAFQTADRLLRGCMRYSGDEYVTHCLNTALILAQAEAGCDTILAGLLHEAILKGYGLQENYIREHFSSNVNEILNELLEARDKTWKEEALMIKTAEWLHNMRTVEFLPEGQQREKAVETLEAFLPKLSVKGEQMEELKAELRDLAIKHM